MVLIDPNVDHVVGLALGAADDQEKGVIEGAALHGCASVEFVHRATTFRAEGHDHLGETHQPATFSHFPGESFGSGQNHQPVSGLSLGDHHFIAPCAHCGSVPV